MGYTAVMNINIYESPNDSAVGYLARSLVGPWLMDSCEEENKHTPYELRKVTAIPILQESCHTESLTKSLYTRWKIR